MRRRTKIPKFWFTTFILDPRHGIDKKYEVVGVKHLKLVLKECGLNLSKVRFEIIDIKTAQQKVKDFYNIFK